MTSLPWQTSLSDLSEALARGHGRAQSAAGLITAALELGGDPAAMFEACWAALFTKADEPRKLGDNVLLEAVLAGLENIRADLRQMEAHLEHLRMVRLSRVLLAELARTSAHAASPRWPTSNAAASRCCATPHWLPGFRSGWTRAFAMC